MHFLLGQREAADRLVKRWHYSRRIPAAVQLVGTWHIDGGLWGDSGEAVAAVYFAFPPTRWAEPVWELVRLGRTEDCPVPPLSGLVAEAVRWLRKRKEIDLLVSYADWTHGHHGGIYQAASWNYAGQRERRMDGVLVGGRFTPGRMANDVWGTRSPRLLAEQGIAAEPHYDEGKHLYWKALNRAGEMKTCLSFGGGGQTTGMLVLIAEGRLARPDAVIMADTGSERPETYAYMRDHTFPYAQKHGIEITMLGPEWRTKSCAGNLEQYSLKYHMLPASFNRWCTDKFKLAAMRRYRRTVMGATPQNPVESWIGISTDEAKRARLSADPSEVKRYPLIEMGLSRTDCEAIVAKAGLPKVPKSGCWFCPFRGRGEYQRLKREEPALFERALAMERNAKPNKHGGARYLPMFGSLERIAAQDELPGFDEAIGAEAECVTGVCFV